FMPVYRQGDPGITIGGYNLRSAADLAFAFDYNHSGKLDHLVLYRPHHSQGICQKFDAGTGTIWILHNNNGFFVILLMTSVYQEGKPGIGIGGYDLRSTANCAFAFDYDHSGKLDHLALYHPGTGTISILRNNNGHFTPVYHQGDPGIGIGGYNLKSTADCVFALDYNHVGKLDYLALYHSATGTIWILGNNSGNFEPVYHQGDPGQGIAGYDLRSPADRAFAFDYGHSSKATLFHPGTGTIWILHN
ncbi:hypothetical protein C8R44DRAFT_531361, partial [Mycena epipterygia]